MHSDLTPIERLRLCALALLLAPTLALAQGQPRLASLGIEIWPEYDRAGAVLVILKGELAGDVKLPAQVALRIPGTSRGPTAMAYSSSAGGSLLNLQHEASTAGDAIQLKFELAERFFHTEFYEPIATALPARSYTYAWPGDLAAERILLVVQEPASASNLEVQPKPDRASVGSNGLRYHAAELGAQAAGKPLPVTVRYTKPDLRPSADILQLKAGAAAPAATAPVAAPAARAGAPFPVSVLVLLAVALLAIGALLMFTWWRRRTARAPLPHGACTRCGAPRRAGDRFCGKCGAKLA